MECEFCEMYETGKTITERLYGDDSEFTAELKVALVTETYRDGYNTGTLRDRAVKFTFCPECGKKLVED